jgi:hypothetical protein
VREDKQLLSCIETVRFIVREQTVLSCIETVRVIVREDKQLLSCIETVRVIVREQTVTELYKDCKIHCEGGQTVTELYRDCKVHCEGGQTVTELYRDCKAHCEGANRRFVSRVKCREIVNCGFNLEFLKLKEVGISNNFKGEGRKGKNSNFIPIVKKIFKQK